MYSTELLSILQFTKGPKAVEPSVLAVVDAENANNAVRSNGKNDFIVFPLTYL
jgi:hypothetical protein